MTSYTLWMTNDIWLKLSSARFRLDFETCCFLTTIQCFSCYSKGGRALADKDHIITSTPFHAKILKFLSPTIFPFLSTCSLASRPEGLTQDHVEPTSRPEHPHYAEKRNRKRTARDQLVNWDAGMSTRWQQELKTSGTLMKSYRGCR